MGQVPAKATPSFGGPLHVFGHLLLDFSDADTFDFLQGFAGCKRNQRDSAVHQVTPTASQKAKPVRGGREAWFCQPCDNVLGTGARICSTLCPQLIEEGFLGNLGCIAGNPILEFAGMYHDFLFPVFVL